MGLARRNKRTALLHQIQRLSVDMDNAVLNAFERHQYAQDGGLAGPGRPDDSDDFVFVDVEVQTVKNREVAVDFKNLFKSDLRCAHLRMLLLSLISTIRTSCAEIRLITRKNTPAIVMASVNR